MSDVQADGAWDDELPPEQVPEVKEEREEAPVEAPVEAPKPLLEDRTAVLESRVDMLAGQNEKLMEMLAKLTAGPPVSLPIHIEPESELPPDPPEAEPEEPGFAASPQSDLKGRGFSEFHRWVLADSLSMFNDKWIVRRMMEKWAGFTARRQRAREQFAAKLRGTTLISSVSRVRTMWKAYHHWRMWLGLRRRHPKSFGLVPRALIYDPEEPEVGDVETIKERIMYHSGEIEELSNVVRRHTEIVELLRSTLQKKLALEMERLTKETRAMEEDANRWSASPHRPTPQPPLPPPAHTTAETNTNTATVRPMVIPVLTHAFSPPSHHPTSPRPLPPQPPFTRPFQGYISSGGDLGPGPQWLTIEEARQEATNNPRCMGFTYNLKHSTVDGKILVYFKTKSTIYSHAGGWCSYTRYNTANEYEEQSHDVMIGDGDELAYSDETYGRSPEQPPAKDPSAVIERMGLDPLMRRRLIDFYQYYNPSKLPSVLHTMHEFQGHEEALFQALTEQYGAEPPPANNILPEGWSLTESSKGDLFYRHVDGKKQWQSPI
eukprot:TRINITY_DN4562_c0_g1_i1.p1 TRINITY_DN4562_c0_g1~~TRINITY_DN4562_c0_g1_i1.p1  ORF type:complete len:562 (+),score=113.33 TRINITY_DN4562_c0_g1_i1:48-1688(+)